MAIDTETPVSGPHAGRLRVASFATRDNSGREQAFVFDARDVDPRVLARCLGGVVADAWNANFDARVIDHAVYGTDDVTHDLVWWDAQLADALLYQGRSGFSWYHGLAWATEHYLGFAAEGKGSTQLSFTATDDLTPDQVRYAAADAVETLWVGDRLRAEIEQAGLATICEIEQAARPFLDRMERAGIPFNWSTWKHELAGINARLRAVVGELAQLTGGGQGTLFDQVTEPTWNPASEKQARAALNRWSPDYVKAWSKGRRGTPALLGDHDSVSASVLREIGGPLATTLLEFREHQKVLSTYGESMRDHVGDDGRMRPQYLQVIGTNTGRLASRNPNAQNFTPLMKSHFRPPDADRVFVHADLSQAELRFLAQVADDAELKAAFERGDDVHLATAGLMFGVDIAELADRDPHRARELRQIAKALNFGIAYGTGAEALARSLTLNGTATTTGQGRELLRQYRLTYPGTARWAQDRIDEIEAISSDTSRIDWTSTLRLARNFAPVVSLRREHRRVHGRWPSVKETHGLTRSAWAGPGSGVDQEIEASEVEWLMSFFAPVALVSASTPFTFENRTLSGRRQQFNLHLDRLFLNAATQAADSRAPAMIEVCKRFEGRTHVAVRSANGSMSRADVERRLEDRVLRRRFVDVMVEVLGIEAAGELLSATARERVRAMVNAWRNAPIQGGVADIMLDAYARLAVALRSFPSAVPVQTVHDSVVIECDRLQATALAHQVRVALEQASQRWCPDVRPAVDVDIRESLADSDIVATL